MTKSCFRFAVILFAFGFGAIASAAAIDLPLTFTYQGRLYDSSENPIADTVDVQFDIFSEDGTCLLYSETKQMDLSQSSGFFSTQIGSVTGSGQRTSGVDPGLEMKNIFDNSTAKTGASACSYTPSTRDGRKIQLTIVKIGAATVNTTLAPKQNISSVPYTTVAQTLQGKTPDGFVQVAGSITQAKLDDLASKHTELMALANGTSTLYAKASDFPLSGGVLNMSTANIRVADIPGGAGSYGDYAVNKNYCDAKVAGLSLDPAFAAGTLVSSCAGNGKLLSWDQANNRWTAVAPASAVTSVALSLPSIFSVSGSPVTGSGTLTAALANQNANTVFAGPSSGGASAPTFRGLAAADIPNLDAAKITSGTIDSARLPVGSTSTTVVAGNDVRMNPGTVLGDAYKVVRVNAAGNGYEVVAPSTFAVDIASNQTGIAGDKTFTGKMTINNDLAVDGTTFNVDSTNNRVGVGTSSPVANLEVKGSPGAPATSGTTQNGLFRIGQGTTNNVMDFGSIDVAPWTVWIQSANRGDLSVNNALALNPNGGYVGIGNINPEEPLHIGPGGDLTSSPSKPNGVANQYFLISDNTSGGSASAIIGVDDGTRKTRMELFVHDNAVAGSGSWGLWSTYGTGGAQPFVIGVSDEEKLRIDTNGNVGIGTTSPQSLIHVHAAAGDANTRYTNPTSGSASTDGFAVGLAAGASNGYLWNIETGDILFGTNNQERMRLDWSGKLGIGTTGPQALLHVKNSGGVSNLYVQSTTTTGQIHIEGSGNSSLYLSDSAAAANKRLLEISSSGGGATFKRWDDNWGASTPLMKFDFTTGYTAIGKTSASDQLDVNGDIRVGTGTTGCVKDADGTQIAGTCSSDERFKKDIRSFSPVAERVAQLRPVHYKWRTDEFPQKHFGEADQLGLIAQEVQKVLPELVSEDDDGYLRVHYSDLSIYMLQALKEHHSMIRSQQLRCESADRAIASVQSNVTQNSSDITSLKSKVATLEQQNTELAKKNADLENRVKALESKMANELAAIKAALKK